MPTADDHLGEALRAIERAESGSRQERAEGLEDALAALDRALATDPSSARAAAVRARTLDALGRREDANRARAMAFALHPRAFELRDPPAAPVAEPSAPPGAVWTVIYSDTFAGEPVVLGKFATQAEAEAVVHRTLSSPAVLAQDEGLRDRCWIVPPK